MRIISFNAAPVAALAYRNSKPGGGGTFVASLPVFNATVDFLPAGLDAVVLTSDLQGRELSGPRLVGEALAPWLVSEGIVSRPDHTIVLLAGDLYASPRADERGSTGDVRTVWRAFANTFGAVAGVAGNHDLFGDQTMEAFAKSEAVHLLDGACATLRGLRVGGVSGIVGKTTKPNRKDDETFIRLLEDVLLDTPDVVVLHQGPDGASPRDKGSASVRATLTAVEAPPIVVFGHCHWEAPFLEEGRSQLVNVDGRVVVLRAGSA
ncbi:hypothetical protein LBMAG42_19970 [Deltaproteobacteria bacterium]|nr:hypothetical protein LBMAG42_19970 [Deltaproteobacteria bacterium]